MTHTPAPDWRISLDDWTEKWIWPATRRVFNWPEPETHQEIYDAKYYDFVDEAAIWSRNAMADAIVRDLAPRTALDVGCGSGALLEALRDRAVEVTGLEYSDAGIEHCARRGLPVYKFDIRRSRLPKTWQKFDVVISFEVAEHLAPSLADRYVKLLSRAGDTIVLSAATPGQGGTNHFNEQPHDYWIQKMARRGLEIDLDTSLRWRAEWQGKTATWYQDNVMVFRRPKKQARAA
jgi:cyclopropane fatty-acyl-phospholipid synthase-like methyltransferase